MRNSLRLELFWLALAVAQLALSEPLNPREWRYHAPTLSTQTRALESKEAGGILAGICQTPLRAAHGVDLTCTTRRLGPAFADIIDQTFHPKGVIFGHFLGPESDDAAVSGSSSESHPDRWGGTLLLSRHDGVWVPVWYRSALILDSCEKVTLPNRREVLLCEDEDAGMAMHSTTCTRWIWSTPPSCRRACWPERIPSRTTA